MSEFKKGDRVTVTLDAEVYDPNVVHGRIVLRELTEGTRLLTVLPDQCVPVDKS